MANKSKFVLAPALVVVGFVNCAGVRMVWGEDARPQADRPRIELTDAAKKLHASALMIDGHNDMPWEIRKQASSNFDKMDISKPQPKLQTDIPRLRTGGVGAQFWSVWVPVETGYRGEALSTTLEQIDLVKRMIARYPETFELALAADDIDRIHKEGRIASLIGVEGGYSIEESLNTLEKLYKLGARYMTLTHSDSLSWADSATDTAKNNGLSPFGKEVVRKMNELGMMVDISHVSVKTMHDALDVSEAPVLFSHSSAKAVADSSRNVPDDVLKRLPEKDGVVMVNFFSGFVVPAAAKTYIDSVDYERELKKKDADPKHVDEEMKRWKKQHPYPRGTIHDVLDHIDHIAKVAGVEHVGLGSDFDGVSKLPTQLEDVSCYPYITQGLLDRGYTEEQIRGILGGNMMRVFRRAEWHAAKHTQAPQNNGKGGSVLDREQYDQFRVTPTDPAALRNRDVERILKKLADSSAGRLRVEKFDESNEGRPIFLATLGTGPRRVLLWSQMHGDEPTHTGVMLDLFSYLLQTPAKPQAAEILSGCTLMFIPMLNPDGAEAVIRYNAQGIDINRDWRRLATPEGRALLRAAKTLKPQFGFNLHNQNARTSVGRPPRPAAVSVLAPAPDLTRKETPSWQAAKQMCACFVDAVRPYALGMISRYDDTHEPRAFGDGIQSLGVSTMLVEAGGWHEDDPEPIVRLHFHGMLNTLHAIATDKYKSTDYQVYDDLPKSNSQRLNDCSITKTHVLDAKGAQPFVADVVIDQTDSERLAVTSSRDGKIVEIGDLPSINARLTLNGSNSLIVPGQFTLVRDWKPGTAFDERRIAELLARGTTTILGVVDLSDLDAIEAFAKPQSLPFNWAFVGNADALSSPKAGEAVERIGIAATNGIVGVVSKGTDEELWKIIHQFGLPLIKADQLAEKTADSYQSAAKQVWTIATSLKQQSRRGRVNRDYFADLLFFSDVANQKAAAAIDWTKLSRVMVAGETVWENGTRRGGTPGVFLRRT